MKERSGGGRNSERQVCNEENLVARIKRKSYGKSYGSNCPLNKRKNWKVRGKKKTLGLLWGGGVKIVFKRLCGLRDVLG